LIYYSWLLFNNPELNVQQSQGIMYDHLRSSCTVLR